MAIAIMLALWWQYVRQKDAAEAAFRQELGAVADIKAKQVNNWRNERLGDGRSIGSSANVRVAERILSTGRLAESDRADMLDLMNRMASAFGYIDAALVHVDGSPAVLLHSADGDPARFRELALATLHDGKVVLSDLYRDHRSGRVLMSMLVPVKDLGAFIFDIDSAQFLSPYIQSWPAQSRTARTILVRKDGDVVVYLNDSRPGGGTALSLRDLFPGLSGASPSVLLAARPFRTVDSRGVPVLLTVRQVPDSPWYLMAKIDAAEVDGPVRRLSWETAFLMILIASANAVGAGLLWRSRERRNLAEQEVRLRQMANETPAYLWMSFGDERNSFVNEPLAKFLGAEGDRLGEHWSAYVHPDETQLALAEFERCLQARCRFEYEFRLRRYDGVYRWMISRGAPRFTSDGRFEGYAGSLSDITERKQGDEQLRAANEALKREVAERTRSEHQVLSLSARLITVQEDERARLAGELHDDFGQQLAAVSIAISNLKRGLSSGRDDIVQQCERIQTKIVELAESARRLSHELHPALLQHSGLAAALEGYCSEFQALTRLEISLETDGVFDCVPPDAALCVYRVAQEALQNVAKHARVDAAEVTLNNREDHIILTVTDRGAGMVAKGGDAAGLGLLSMKERARLVNGTLEVRGGLGQGTILVLRVPVGHLVNSMGARDDALHAHVNPHVGG